jgi:two-component system nitrate/nitrite response regulator NarL
MKELKDVKIVIADDHPFILKGLYDHLISQDLNVIGQASDETQALQLIIDNEPEIAILDLEMPYLSGYSIAEIVKSKNLSTQVIILTVHKEEEFITQAKGLNISGYLLKEDTAAEIILCLDQVVSGENYFSPNILDNAINSSDKKAAKLTHLTPSEIKILKLISDKKNSQEIAELFHVSERTVEKHRSNIIGKLALNGQSNSLTNWAIENRNLLNSL